MFSVPPFSCVRESTFLLLSGIYKLSLFSYLTDVTDGYHDLGCLTTIPDPNELIGLDTLRNGAKALTPQDNNTLFLKTSSGKFTVS